jgi:hypothetical protein
MHLDKDQFLKQNIHILVGIIDIRRNKSTLRWFAYLTYLKNDGFINKSRSMTIN